jgi:hypothetical protein
MSLRPTKAEQHMRRGTAGPRGPMLLLASRPSYAFPAALRPVSYRRSLSFVVGTESTRGELEDMYESAQGSQRQRSPDRGERHSSGRASAASRGPADFFTGKVGSVAWSPAAVALHPSSELDFFSGKLAGATG